jgi:hypothetical protein
LSSITPELTFFFFVGGGLAVGMVVSVALFRRRTWPAVFGAGLGLGTAYGNCQHTLNEPFLVPAARVKVGVSIASSLVLLYNDVIFVES